MAGTGADGPNGVRFNLLGTLQVTRNGSRVPLGGPRQRAVLALLLIEANSVVSLDRLVDQVWDGRPPARAVTSIQTYVFHLRRALEPARVRGDAATMVITQDSGYLLRVDPAQVDRDVFEGLLWTGTAALEAGRAAEASEHLGAALELWRGSFLADLDDHEFVRVAATRLEGMRLNAAQNKIEADLALGRHPAVAAELDHLVALHPLREGLHRQLMLARYRCGRQADALAAYDHVRRLLDAELGVKPGEPLQQLHRSVLAHDPSLDWHREVTPISVPIQRGRDEPGVLATTSEWVIAAAHTRRLPRLLAAATVLALVAAVITAVAARPDPTPRRRVSPDSLGVLSGNGKRLLADVPVGSSPDGLAAAGGSVWAVNSATSTVSRVDAVTRTVRQVVPVGVSPSALAVNGDDVWVVNSGDGTVSRINAATNAVVQSVRVGNLPAAIAADARGVWVANSGDGTVSRIDPGTGVVTRTVAVGAGPDGIAVGAGAVWVANGQDGTVSRIHPETFSVSGPIPVGAGPEGVAVTSQAVWVGNASELSVSRLDPATGRVVATIPVGDGPRTVVAGAGAVWVSEEYGGGVTRIDPDTNAVRRTVFDGGAPRGLAVVGPTVWVAARAFAATPHSGGTLRVVTRQEPGIDPVTEAWPQFWRALRLVYDGLVGLRRTGGASGLTLVPNLATSLPRPTDGGRTYTFTLRPGVRYSTGEVARPGDIRRGVQRQFTTGGGNPGYYTTIVGGTACLKDGRRCDLSAGIVTDDSTSSVTFHLTAPDPDFLAKLTLVFAVPPGSSMSEVRTRPLPGTGPYKIDGIVPGRRLTLVRNPYFHQWSFAARPAGYPDRVQWETIPDAQERTEAVSSGRADLVGFASSSDSAPAGVVDALAVRYPARVHTDFAVSTDFQWLNTRVPPFDDVRVRRAVNYAVDRRRVASITGGARVAVPTCQILPPNFPGYRPYCPYTTSPRADGSWSGPDLATARRLVSASGTGGAAVSLWAFPGRRGQAIGRYFVQVLRQLGYRAVLREPPATDETYRRGASSTSLWGADFPTASNFFIPVLTCKAGYNPAQYCNPRVDALVRRAQLSQAADPGHANRLWAQVDRTVVDDAPWVPTISERETTLVSGRVGNYQDNPILGPLPDQMWVR